MRLSRKKFLVILLSLVLLVMAGICVLRVLRAYQNPDYAISYETDQGMVEFHIKYNELYFNQMNIAIENNSVVMKDEKESKNNAGILSRIGMIQREDIIPFKVMGMGKEEILVFLGGRYQDTVCLEKYEVSVSNEEIVVTKVS